MRLSAKCGLDKFEGDDKMKIIPVHVLLAIMIVSSLAGGSYFGYQSGNTDARKAAIPAHFPFILRVGVH